MPEAVSEAQPILGILDNLIAVNRDAAARLSLALGQVRDGELSVEIQRFAQRRLVFVEQLERARSAYCANAAPPSGSLAGGLHRAWIRIRTSVPLQQQHGLLRELLRGERFSLKHYHAAVLQYRVLPVGLIALIGEQHLEIKAFREQLRAFWRTGKLPSRSAPVPTTSATVAVPVFS
jgi:uncharacterized protein (TIGR02284 family)